MTSLVVFNRLCIYSRRIYSLATHAKPTLVKVGWGGVLFLAPHANHAIQTADKYLTFGIKMDCRNRGR